MTALIFVALTAFLHFAFMYIEMFRWPWMIKRVARMPAEVADQTTAIGFNQGLYNGFIAVGLTLSLFSFPTADQAHWMQIYMLACVVVAGVVGYWTVGKPTFLVVQSGPALLAFLAMGLGI